MTTKRRICFLILDGLGEGPLISSNPQRWAKLKNFDYFKKNYPFCLLASAGIPIGLPSYEAPNCELAHLTIGTGMVHYKNWLRINLAIENGEFYKNRTLQEVFQHCSKFNSRLHLIGLISESKNETDINHLFAILKLAQSLNFKNIYFHFITDGIDSWPKSASNLIQNFLKEIRKQNYPGEIATLCGRYYALDETRNYTLRTQKYFLLIVEGIGTEIKNPLDFLKNKYNDENFKDDILEPIIINKEGIIRDNDAILFFHFENKSIVQLANAFLNPIFKEFSRPPRKNLFIASFTRYLDFNYPVLFEEKKILTNLSRILSENNLTQLKITDVSREKLLKDYFNGFIQEAHYKEIYKIFPAFSSDPEELDKQSIDFINNLVFILQKSDFNFILVNFPILDIIGHKGDFKLAVAFLEKVDQLIEIIYKTCFEKDYLLIITSDHGNIEQVIDPRTSKKDIQHNLNPVPFYLIDKNRKREKTTTELNFYSKKILGSLVDIAPTILDIFNISPPREFEGKSLLRYF